MAPETTSYSLKTVVPADYESVVERVREALDAEGFGVLTEIDMKATMKKKLDVDVRRYIILGACNAPIAHAALMFETDLGLLLPCNVIVYEGEDTSETVVAAIDPVVQLGVTGNDDITPMAEEVRGKLARVLESLTS